MREMPDDAVAQFQAAFFEQIVVVNIQRIDFTVLHIIADLPAQAAVCIQHPDQFINNTFLSAQISF